MKRGLTIGAILLLVVGVVRWMKYQDQEIEENTNSELLQKPDVAAFDGAQFSPRRIITRSPFMEIYADDNGDTLSDLEAVSDLLTDCQLILKDFDSYFLPDNQAITAFLRGKNKEGIAWIPPGHPAVSEGGELMDRFGVPLFFHREGGKRVQFRSAGEDRKMWTSDDVVYPPTPRPAVTD